MPPKKRTGLVQAFLFDRKKFTVASAKRWLMKKLGITPSKIHSTKNYIRARINEPDFDRYETRGAGPGVKAVIGYGGPQARAVAKQYKVKSLLNS